MEPYEFIRYEFEARVTSWDDFEESWNDGQTWIRNFEADEETMGIINQLLAEKRKQTT